MTTEAIAADTRRVARDLAWIDMLKGVAIVAVFFDNWIAYMGFDSQPAALYALGQLFKLAVGPFVQVFFILSGFGLTLSYLKRGSNWSWSGWAWRRFAKIVAPYYVAVIASFALGMLGSQLYPSLDMRFSWLALLAYLTFTRNFFPDTWDWNRPMWFMPILVGLYLSFPLLIRVLEKWGPRVLLLLSAAITFGTIALAQAAGIARGHQSDLFSAWMIQFVLGMLLAYMRHARPERLDRLIGLRAFLLGIGLFAFSWALRSYLPAGKAYNDIFSSVGIFLILLNACWLIWGQSSTFTRVLTDLSARSYLMYLVHYPILAFLVGPLLATPANPAVVIGLGGVFVAAVFLFSAIIAPPMDRLTAWLYRRYRVA